MKMRSCTLQIVCALLVAVIGCKDAPTAADRMPARRAMCEQWMQRASNPAYSIFNQEPDSPFMTDVWHPSLRKAKLQLDRLEQGKIKTVPLFSFARPVGSGYYLIAAKWLQSDEELRQAVVHDRNGIIGRMTYDEAEPDVRLTFSQGGLFEIATQAQEADAAGAQHQPTVAVLRAERSIDFNSLRISIETLGAEGWNEEHTMDVSLFPPLPPIEK